MRVPSTGLITAGQKDPDGDPKSMNFNRSSITTDPSHTDTATHTHEIEIVGPVR